MQSKTTHKGPLYIIVQAATNVCEIRAEGEQAIANMRRRADEVIEAIDSQHHQAMLTLNIEHQARMITTIKGWWSNLSAEDKADWFCAWDDYNFKKFTNPKSFDLAVFAFLKGHHHLADKKGVANV